MVLRTPALAPGDRNGFVWLGVRPEARRRGLGSALWELAEKHLDAIGVARINADVVGDEAGARFLERRGSKPSARS